MVKNLPAMWETYLTTGSGRSPETGNSYPSSILAWRIPWTGQPGGLQSMESQRVRYN